jgi:hypothetical protein
MPRSVHTFGVVYKCWYGLSWVWYHLSIWRKTRYQDQRPNTNHINNALVKTKYVAKTRLWLWSSHHQSDTHAQHLFWNISDRNTCLARANISFGDTVQMHRIPITVSLENMFARRYTNRGLGTRCKCTVVHSRL